MYWIAGVILFAIVAVLFTNLFCKPNFDKTAKELKINSKVIATVSMGILADYGENWKTAINSNRAINEKGESDWCSDFSMALSWRHKYYTNEGHFETIDSLCNVLKEQMRIIDNASSKYKDEKEMLMNLYDITNTLASLANDPKGSLFTYNQMVNEAAIQYEKIYKQTEVKFPVTDEELTEFTKKAFASMLNKQLEKIKKKEAEEELLKAEGKRFLEQNMKKDGVITTPSGLQYKILKKGNGVIPTETSMVKFHYEGRTIDGKVFESTYKRGRPTEIRPKQFILGLTEALTHMPAGSIWEVYIPQELGYGGRQAGEIKPFSTLIFKIELISVKKE